jgi:parallel beta-helix repeat protein
MRFANIVRCAGAAIALAMPIHALATVKPVADTDGLIAAIANAAPGDVIELADGVYQPPANLNCTSAGTEAAPIIVRAAHAHAALVRFAAPGTVAEGFKISAPYWRFEGLDIEGACLSDDDCEHAFHLAGNADFTRITGNRIRDFNAQIKSNTAAASSGVFPDDVRVIDNEIYDTRARMTANPVTKIDVVGGRRWIVRGNTIHDFQKNGGDSVSYGAFLKGNSRDGVFERNLVTCENAFSGGVRIGLSFGGGGTSPASICEDGTCTPEHQGGIMRNNLIVKCSDVGIYLNKAANSSLQHNTLYATTGIDVRFAESSADIRNNLVGGLIRNRDGATSSQSGNLTSISNETFAAWFTAPASADFRLVDGGSFVDLGVSAPLVTDDFCGNDRDDGEPDIGALEYDADFACLTTAGGGIDLDRLFADGFES